MHPALNQDRRHPEIPHGAYRLAVYVWQYPIRLFHWGLVISIGVLAVHRILHPRSIHRGSGEPAVSDGLVSLRS